MRKLLAVGLFTLVPLLAAACGDDDSSSDSGSENDGASSGDGATELAITAKDLSFSPGELDASPGDIEVTMTNEGQIEHNWAVEDHESELKLDTPRNGDTDTGTINLPAGTYTYYCDVAGHRSAGMEGTLTVG